MEELALGGVAMMGITWRLDSLDGWHDAPVRKIGSPRIELTDRGAAIAFDCRDDGLIVADDPLAGADRFTLEALFMPRRGGLEEQRFVHLQADDQPDRALLELRLASPDHWYADTFIGTADHEHFLNDPALTHPMEQWHTLALVCDGRTMSQWVNGQKELEMEIRFQPRPKGKTALGMRINQVWWFCGLLHTIRMTPAVVEPKGLLRP
ncbi:MAG: hypothetical protein JJU36_14080 [Phycisphaeraceae bacterium]|nr:hypothetical protein [Phycisphaeraceae bacterium]